MEKHPHATAIERIGRAAIMSHFNISRQAVSKWTQQGVPPRMMQSVRLLAATKGVGVHELYVEEKTA